MSVSIENKRKQQQNKPNVSHIDSQLSIELLIYGFISETEKQFKLCMEVPIEIYHLISSFCWISKFQIYSSNTISNLLFNTQICFSHDIYHIENSKWKISELIAKTNYSCIFKGINKKNGNIVALKFIPRGLKISQQTDIKTEIKALSHLRHENIISLLSYNLNVKFSDTDSKYHDLMLYVFEYASGGHLYDVLYFTDNHKLKPILARTYFIQLLSAIEYMHKNGIIHGNIHPNNLLLDNKYNLKITGFEMCKIVSTQNSNIKMNDWNVGIDEYKAPEIFRKQEYDKKIDIFSMGVILFFLLAGYAPFVHANNCDNWYKFIVNKKYKNFWKSHRKCGLQKLTTDLVTRMIVYDSNKRISINKIKKHKWIINNKILNCTILSKIFKLRHQRMEIKRNKDPNKQIINYYTHKKRGKQYYSLCNEIKHAGKTEKDLPPKLPIDETISPFDIYVSKHYNAYEILMELRFSIKTNLLGHLCNCKISIDNTIELETDGDINIYNFSFIFVVRVICLNNKTDLVYVYVCVYWCDIAECNIVKFTRLCGKTEVFARIMEILGSKCGYYLTGLDKMSVETVQSKLVIDNELESVYHKCFS
eukprot:311878_1